MGAFRAFVFTLVILVAGAVVFFEAARPPPAESTGYVVPTPGGNATPSQTGAPLNASSNASVDATRGVPDAATTPAAAANGTADQAISQG